MPKKLEVSVTKRYCSIITASDIREAFGIPLGARLVIEHSYDDDVVLDDRNSVIKATWEITEEKDEDQEGR